MSRILIGLAVAMFASPPDKPAADQATRELQRKIVRLRTIARRARAARIRESQDEIAGCKARVQEAKRRKIDPDQAGWQGRLQGTYTYTDRREKRRAIRALQAELAKAEARLARLREPWTFIPGLPHPPKVGDMGEVSFVRVLQIVDADEMRVTYYGHDLWLRGIDTKNLVDEVGLKPTGIFEVIGTKAYTTVLGSMSTVLLVEPVPIPAELLRLGPIETKGKKRRRSR